MSSVLVRTPLFLSELFFQQVTASHFHVEWIKRVNRERDSQSCDRVATAIGILLATVGAISKSLPPVVLRNTSAILGVISNAQ